MSNFTCPECNTDILEGENGCYVTGCKHYPIRKPDNKPIKGVITHNGVNYIYDEIGRKLWEK